MTSRKDLPRCRTCKWWSKLTTSMGGRLGECHVFDWADWAVPKYFGCIHHPNYDEPETQTETDDE